MEALVPFLIVCPLTFLAGFVDAIAGGGGLISLPAFLMAGLPPHMCLATNKMSSCMGTALATVRFALMGYIRGTRVVPCVLCALGGAALGARVALALSAEVLTWVMLVMVPLTAIYVLRPKSLQEKEGALPPRREMAVAALVAFTMGAYDGFYGPGTGTFMMIGFMTLAHLPLNEAAGLTKATNLSTNLAALVVFLLHGQVWLLLGLMAGLFNMAGAWLGVSLFASKGLKAVKPVIVTVLVIFMIRMLAELL